MVLWTLSRKTAREKVNGVSIFSLLVRKCSYFEPLGQQKDRIALEGQFPIKPTGPQEQERNGQNGAQQDQQEADKAARHPGERAGLHLAGLVGRERFAQHLGSTVPLGGASYTGVPWNYHYLDSVTPRIKPCFSLG